jgi:hypothetical protein
MTAALEEPFDVEQEIRKWVNEAAPKVFAVVGEWDCEDDGRDAAVYAWGLEHPDGRVLVVGEEDRRLMLLKSTERAVWWFERMTGDSVRLVWAAAA